VYLSLDVIEMLIEIYPNAVNVTDTEGKLPSHTACLRGATSEVIQLLFDRLVGDEQHQNGLSISDNRGQLPIHYYARSENARAEVLQHLLELYPGGIRVVDTFDMLFLLTTLLTLSYLRSFASWLKQAAPYTVIQKCSDGRTPIQHAWNSRNRDVEVATHLLERQNEAVNAMKEASLRGCCQYAGESTKSCHSKRLELCKATSLTKYVVNLRL
jgi:ankyrin repeat protein